MKNRTESRAAVVLSTVLALAAFACSSSAPDTGLGDPPKKDAPSSAKKTDDKSSTTDTDKTTPAPSTPLADSSECGKKATAMDCGDCCIAKNPAAWDASEQIGFDCICAATACQTACAESVCAAADNQNEPTAACKTCLDTNGPACDDKAIAACDANADCKAIDSCLVTSCEPLAQKEGASGSSSGGTPKVLTSRGAMRAARQQ